MRVALVATLLALAGCYPAYQSIQLKTPYNPKAVAWAKAPGENAIEGTAMMRTRGGDVRTCAALDVALTPVSVYAKERMIYLYGNVRGGFRPIYMPVSFEPDAPEFYASTRTVKCNAQGEFSFEGLADGDWYVSTAIFWEVPGAGFQGGSLMQRVRVEGGQTAKVTLAP